MAAAMAELRGPKRAKSYGIEPFMLLRLASPCNRASHHDALKRREWNGPISSAPSTNDKQSSSHSFQLFHRSFSESYGTRTFVLEELSHKPPKKLSLPHLHAEVESWYHSERPGVRASLMTAYLVSIS